VWNCLEINIVVELFQGTPGYTREPWGTVYTPENELPRPKNWLEDDFPFQK
jgi:hypothetical protein